MVIIEDFVFLKTDDALESLIFHMLGLKCLDYRLGKPYKYECKKDKAEKYVYASAKIKKIVLEVKK